MTTNVKGSVVHSAKKHGALRIGHSSPLWRTRRTIRKVAHATHRARKGASSRPRLHKRLHVYSNVDEFARTFFPRFDATISKKTALDHVKTMIDQLNYQIVEADEQKPWGGMYRLADDQIERFIAEFFPGLTLDEARLGRSDVRLSPKFLLVEPGKRLSWQYHVRRAERWHFLLPGSYSHSYEDNPSDVTAAIAGTIVQLAEGERHRVSTANATHYTLLAEIWQHTNPTSPSDENDIIRLQDDYRRA
ncbi:hypothetical protein H7142_03665 [Candidatus Saccharibacteria bacterium]|nr:hypothetical protein [Candidatus Saccharibacteria bacterium]